MNNHKTKYLLTEILLGRSKIPTKKFGVVYVKHLDNIMLAEVEAITEDIEKNAIKSKLQTLKEKLEELDKDGIWTKKNEQELEDKKGFITNLKKTRAKFFLKRDIESFSAQIQGEEGLLRILEARKSENIGLTVEQYSAKRSSQYYVFFSLYKDPELKQPLFNEEDFLDLDFDTMEELYVIYNQYADNFTINNIKRIAISPIFLNLFYLCEDDAYKFYGKPIYQLTFNQIELFSDGRYYKKILMENEGKIPDSVQNDPDKLVEWFEHGQAARKIIDNSQAQDGVAVSIVGATKEDLKNLNIESDIPNTNVLDKELDKHGGRLTLDDMIRLGMV